MDKEFNINGKTFQESDMKPFTIKPITKPKLSKNLSEALFVISQHLLILRNEISSLNFKLQESTAEERKKHISTQIERLNIKRNSLKRNRTTILSYLLDAKLLEVTGWYNRFENQPNLQLIQVKYEENYFVTQCSFKEFKNLKNNGVKCMGNLPAFEPIENEKLNAILSFQDALSTITLNKNLILDYKRAVKKQINIANTHDHLAKELRKQNLTKTNKGNVKSKPLNNLENSKKKTPIVIKKKRFDLRKLQSIS